MHGRKKWAYYYDPARSSASGSSSTTSCTAGAPGRWTGRPSGWRPASRTTGAGTGRPASGRQPRPSTARSTCAPRAARARRPGTLEAAPGGTAEQVSYDSLGSGLAPRRAEFEITFAAPAELIGHTTATLYLSSPEAEDLDVFVALFKLDAGGAHVGFPYYAQFEDGPAAVGWQRASHRELDPARSTPYLPVLAHQRALPVPAGEMVRLDIEVLPSGTRFEAGEKLLLVVQGTDVNRYPKPAVYARHEDTVNNGPHILHTGGRFGSRLVIPVLPGNGRGWRAESRPGAWPLPWPRRPGPRARRAAAGTAGCPASGSPPVPPGRTRPRAAGRLAAIQELGLDGRVLLGRRSLSEQPPAAPTFFDQSDWLPKVSGITATSPAIRAPAGVT